MLVTIEFRDLIIISGNKVRSEGKGRKEDGGGGEGLKELERHEGRRKEERKREDDERGGGLLYLLFHSFQYVFSRFFIIREFVLIIFK